MAAQGIPFNCAAFAANGTLFTNCKIWGWVPTSLGAKTSTPVVFYSDPALTTPATQGGTYGDTSGRRVIYYSPSTAIVLEVKSTDEATALGDYYFPSILLTSNALDDLGTIRVCATYAEMTALTADELTDNCQIYVTDRATEGDGGGGMFVWRAGDSTTADGGTVLAHDSISGRFFRLHDGTFYIDWFGDSSDWGAALTAAWTACGVRGGTVKHRQGGDYIFTTQATMPVTEFNITWDIRGCRIRPRYASGATFKFGTGASLLQELTILGNSAVIDPGTSGEGSQSQPLLELRGVRTMRILGIRMLNIYQLAKWGDVSDAQPCYQIFLNSCDINMRLNADGGHTHGIMGDGSSGGLYLTDTYVEGDAGNLASAVNFLQLTSAQAPTRLDHISIQGGNIKGWDRCVSAVDARVVNLETDTTARFDESLEDRKSVV